MGASGRRADVEAELLAPNTQEMTEPNPKRARSSGGGFGGRQKGGSARGAAGFGSTSSRAETTEEKLETLRAQTLTEDGVVLIKGGLERETALALREAVIDEIKRAREAVRLDPAASPSRFHVPVEQPTRAFTLLPFRDEASAAAGHANGPIIQAMRELLGRDAAVGNLFGRMCDGSDSQLHDFYALRTEPGSARQQVHFDTPFQKTPPLFAAFIALQDVTIEMGPTVFLPKTHTRTAARKAFDGGIYDGRRDAMLAKARSNYALLSAGDLVMFDMRTLHAGTANQLEKGSTRYFLCVTFRNLKANDVELGHIPCIRAGYVEKFNLGEIRDELDCEMPFSAAGDGLPSL